MSTNKAILAIIVGIGSILAAFGMKQFYASDLYGRLGRPIPRWQGRLLFLTVGILFCFIGIAYFFTDH